MKVLVVEADAATRFLLVELLRARGHRVSVAEDLERAWSLYEQELFPLLILDWASPQAGGAELCRRVRSAPHGADPIILALVERAESEDLLPILDAGANDFLTDPRHVALLRERLTVAERYAETIEQRRHGARDEAKRTGDSFAVYDRRTAIDSPQRQPLMNELHRAVEREEFLLHYLPKVDLRSGDITGLEALVRWEHPQRGLLLPGEFIPLAEETGLIGPLCRWVLNAALRQAQVWRRTGVRLPVEVNLSKRNLQDPELPDAVAHMLHRWGVTPSMLHLEIAERAVGEQPERASHTLGQLRTLGIAIGVDDFGTGGASRASLARLSLDELKVDRCLVEDMLVNERHADAVRAAIELGHDLGVAVVAEGVGDAATRDRLAAYGCDLGQGFYLGRPMPAVELFSCLTMPET